MNNSPLILSKDAKQLKKGKHFHCHNIKMSDKINSAGQVHGVSFTKNFTTKIDASMLNCS